MVERNDDASASGRSKVEADGFTLHQKLWRKQGKAWERPRLLLNSGWEVAEDALVLPPFLDRAVVRRGGHIERRR